MKHDGKRSGNQCVALDRLMGGMLNLRSFNDAKTMVVFDLTAGIGVEEEIGDEAVWDFAGFSNKYKDNHVALYSLGNQMLLQLEKRLWNFNDQELNLRYNHLENGVTSFKILSKGICDFEATYPSWWTRHPERVIPGFDSPPDDEEDFWAYVTMVWNDTEMKENLIKTWSRD